MKIICFNPLQINNNIQIKQSKNITRVRMSNSLSTDTVSFGQRSYDNIDPNMQLYRGIGGREIRALFKGKTIEGLVYSTSNPRGYCGGVNWTSYGGYGDYFIAFNKKKIKFIDHRDYDSDTRYLVKSYNLADVKSIRKGENEHGELIYSMDFEKDKRLDVLLKQKDIKETLTKLKKWNLSKEEKKICIGNLESYSKEFPYLEKAISVANIKFGRHLLMIKEKFLTPSIEQNEVNDKEIMNLIKSVTPKKVKEFGAIRDIKEKVRLLNVSIDYPNTEYFECFYTGADRAKFFEELKQDMDKVKTRLKVLTELETKNNVVKFEIKSLTQALEKFNKLKI